MTEQVKRQIIKAFAYGKSKEEIKAEKNYYKEMGYLQ